jgi:chorismate mutase
MSAELELLRFEIDRDDDLIVELLAARFRRLEQVAQVKALAKLPGHDPTRETAILKRVARTLRHLDEETRLDVLEIVRAMLERGRAHVKRRVRDIQAARHDGVDGKVALDSGSRQDPQPARRRG